ncbi:MAG: inner membrane CreD family protein [Firmicutes bacterium]|nr:inner membrane CreD family protein [Bacillota bacterium]
MIKRIVAIVFIYLCTAAAWVVLGATLFHRTYSAEENLRGQVESIWGAAHIQRAPVARDGRAVDLPAEVGRSDSRSATDAATLPVSSFPLERTRAQVALTLEPRQKGLLWYNTYRVAFQGEYTFRNPADRPLRMLVEWKLPAAQALYDDLVVLAEGRPVEFRQQGDTIAAEALVGAHQTVPWQLRYRSQGLGAWRYDFGDGVTRVRDFELRLTTNCKEIDFPQDTLAATEKRPTDSGWELLWTYTNLMTGYDLGVALPEKLQPGPLAARISFFAPVSLFFFFFLMFLLTTLRQMDLHPMNYFFLAAAFFAFHLLLAYLVDRIAVPLAFALSAAVSLGLVISYLGRAVGWHFAWREAGLAQFVYLVVFSSAFFLEGYTGLTITILSILTLFVVMQMTARVRWSEKFTSR